MFNPLNLFKKDKDGKDGEGQALDSEPNSDLDSAESSDGNLEQIPEKKSSEKTESGIDILKISTDLDKLKASVESFSEIRKATTERITGLSEQIGELRAMILDRDRTIQQLELKAVKATDLVESVQPDKLMTGLQKADAKFEALKANLEGNEAIINKVMDELKEVRKKIEFFRGIEEVIKLSEEVKKELVTIKKVEASVHADTDKVDTIYSELRKRFQEVDLFNDNLQELKANLAQNSKDIDVVKTKILDLTDRQEFEKLTNKVQRYIEAMQTINKSSILSKDLAQLKSLLEGG